jgi:oligoribonuclease NrnB/cAMP/cGMP phosphodiesterase (DHH superfamily)
MINFDMVIYHGNCPDGFTSAWVFKHNYRLIETIAYTYGQPPPNVKNKIVAIVDFSFDKETTLQMISDSKYLVVLDHHLTAKENLKDIIIDPLKGEIIFDMNRAGAQIAWDYLHPSQTTNRPWFIEYVADRDLWLHMLPRTKEISFALQFDGYFNNFTKMETLFNTNKETNIDLLIARGETLLCCKDLEVNQAANMATLTELKTSTSIYNVRITTAHRMYVSDVGNLVANLFNDCDFAAIYWYDPSTKKCSVSFRASDDSTINLSDVMRGLPNAGGHPKAAAFSFIGFDNFHIYFKNIEIVSSHIHNKLELSLPPNLEYVFKELQEYRSSMRQSILKLNDRMYNINIAYVPIHYHKKLINSYYDDMMICLVWYHFESRIWYITIKSFNNIILKDLFFSYNHMDITFLEDNYLEWKLNELKNEHLTTYFI